MSYLLDSSALLAFYFAEPGGARVLELLSDDDTEVASSVLSMAEFWSRLRAAGSDDEFEEEWRTVSQLVSAIHPVSLDVVSKSLSLRSAAIGRLPHIDALIAATAALLDAVLVHRDPHFGSIPMHLLKQKVLPDK